MDHGIWQAFLSQAQAAAAVTRHAGAVMSHVKASGADLIIVWTCTCLPGEAMPARAVVAGAGRVPS